MPARESKANFRKYEIIEHLSDVKLKVYGKTLKKLFENAAEGMFFLITDLSNVKKTVTEEIIISTGCETLIEDLLIIWLEKLIYLCEVKNQVFSGFKVRDLKKRSNGYSLSAETKGERINLKKHEILIQIKAPTYHELQITRESKTGLYNVEIIFDV